MITKHRGGEIAILILKHKLRKEGLHLSPEVKRTWGNMAKDIGVPFEELLEFAEGMAREAMEEFFAKTKK